MGNSNIVKIGDIAEVFDGPHATPKKIDVGPFFLSISSLENGQLDLSKSAHISDEQFKKWTRRVTPRVGDVLFSYETRLGEAALMPDGVKACLGRRMGLLRPRKDRVLPEYLLYAYLSPEFQQQIKRRTNHGATVERISLKELPDFEIRIPSIEEQQQVVQVIKAFPRKLEVNQQVNQTLEQMAQALFKSWFVDFDPVVDNALAAGNPIPDELGHRVEVRKKAHAIPDFQPLPEHIRNLFPNEFEQTGEPTVGIGGWVPKGWNIVPFGEISKCFDSKRVPLSKKQRDEKKPGSIPYYGATSVMDYVDDYIFDGIFLLVGEDGSVAKPDGTPFTQYIWGKSWVNNHAHILQGKGSISTEHLLLFMNSTNINAYVTGAVQMKINQKNMNSIPFIKPTDQICKSFNELLKPTFQKTRYQVEENKTLKVVRDYLLPKLIAGEIQLDSSGISSINQEAELQGV